ncbi:response regulator [Pseudomonas tremae]|uniref:Response regulator n=3 Tax=Pseudomonas syringae group TaxID=136849 RepID=A0AAE6QHL6_9PSED|nr:MULTISPECIES: response regulator [Pseudomonas syringae group]KGS12189.1 chemotaxis protein CheY [Pseudomonas coronafaciens]KPB49435.1 Response regulator [Pseudomonas coronafaciens pv. oryzae]KPW33867.1 Response regulator [Pseudomonas coronafaciens pv. atropurpurea]KPY02623.1 Response regulator [Pseudomonas coronafaciens pv. oryzae]KPZ25175.1 Response regulator receiver [Pseudomonas coronafaciens pv. zizaniae]
MSSESNETSLPKVLLVEDETILAMLMEMTLEDLGFITAYHASSLGEGIEYARDGDYDLAILDINIIGGTSFAIATVIADRGIPFMFCSGYGRLGIPEAWLDRQCVTKPFSAEQLDNALTSLLQG